MLALNDEVSNMEPKNSKMSTLFLDVRKCVKEITP